MKLKDYLAQENLTFAAFGRKCQPQIPRVTIRQYALEQRFPADKRVFQIIEVATDGAVTANDFVKPSAEVAA